MFMLLRSRRSLPICGLLALIFLLAACGGGDANAPDAKQLLSDAQAAIQKVKSYHFNLVAENPGTTGNVVIKDADGDTLVPDKLQAQGNVLMFGNTAQVKLIAIGDKQYITDPITGKWTEAPGVFDPRALSNPQTGLAAILGNIQNPSTPTESDVDGTPCWSTSGKLDAKYIAGITGSGAAPAGTTVDTTTCIGKTDKLPYLIKMSGVAVQGDTTQTVRTFKLSKYNEDVTIQAPM
jgi:lipoprotein LprG